MVVRKPDLETSLYYTALDMPNNTIVVYIYDSATGVFLFSEYAEESPREKGVYLTPPYSTTIVPPNTAYNEKAIFNVDTQVWEILVDEDVSRDYKLLELMRQAFNMAPKQLDRLELYAQMLLKDKN